MFNGQIPNSPFSGSGGNVVVGGEPGGGGKEGWLSRLFAKLFPAGVGAGYKALVAGGVVLSVALVAGLVSLFVFVLSDKMAYEEVSEPGASRGQIASEGGLSDDEQSQNGEDQPGEGDEDADKNENENGSGDDTGNEGEGNDPPGGQPGGNGNGSGGGSGGGNGGGNGGGSDPPAPPAPPSPAPDRCAPPNFPDANCTGWQHTGVSLTPYTGPTNITQAGTVIDGKDITDCIAINADNVTIKRSRIRCAGYWLVRMHGNNGLVEDVEIDALGFTGANCLMGDNYTARRINCHNTGDGIRLGSNVTIEDSFIHSLVTEPGSHNDAIQATGAVNSVIRHNRIENRFNQTGCIKLGSEFGPLRNILVENNLFNGGGYTIYGGGNDGDVGSLRFINNRFMRAPQGFFPNGGYYGPVAYYNPSLPGNQWSGNVWHDNGAPITP